MTGESRTGCSRVPAHETVREQLAVKDNHCLKTYLLLTFRKRIDLLTADIFLSTSKTQKPRQSLTCSSPSLNITLLSDGQQRSGKNKDTLMYVTLWHFGTSRSVCAKNFVCIWTDTKIYKPSYKLTTKLYVCQETPKAENLQKLEIKLRLNTWPQAFITTSQFSRKQRNKIHRNNNGWFCVQVGL